MTRYTYNPTDRCTGCTSFYKYVCRMSIVLENSHRLYGGCIGIIGDILRSFAFNDTTGVGDVYLPGSLSAINKGCPI